MSKTQEFILTCSCFRMDKKAAESFSFLFPNKLLPEIVRGKDKIYKLSRALDNEHIKAISKLSGKFAYYVELEGDTIVKEYDLLKGRRIA